MKKKINKPIRAAGVLLVATMLSTCLTAGTFAKYTTTDSATDSARVAKFGVNVNVNGYLFGKEYAKGDTNTPISYSGIYPSTGTGSVQVYYAGGTNTTNVADLGLSNVVAPGTKNTTGLGFSISGKPEVDCATEIEIEARSIYLTKGSYATMESIKVNSADDLAHAISTYGKANIYELDDASDTSWSQISQTTPEYKADHIYFKIKDVVDQADANWPAEAYFPVVFSLAKGDSDTVDTSVVSTGNYSADSLKAAFDAIKGSTAIASTEENASTNKMGYTAYKLTSHTQKANREFDVDAPNEILTWEWAFENGDTDTKKAFFNKLDTILGNLVAQDKLADSAETTNPYNKAIANADGVCRVVKLEGTEYKVPTAADETDAKYAVGSDGTTKQTIAISNVNDYNLKTAVYLKATATQVD